MKIQKHLNQNNLFQNLSEMSLSLLRETKIIPREEQIVYSYLPLFDGVKRNGMYGDLFYGFKKVPLEHHLIGVDASIVPLAESDKGYVFALRGAAVKYDLEKDDYIIYLEGPYIFYLTSETLVILSKYLNGRYMSLSQGLLNYMYAKKIVLGIYEWMLIQDIVIRSRDAILLVDGVIEPVHLSRDFYEAILEDVRENNVFLIGISKRSKYLKYFSEIASTLLLLGVEGMVKIEIPTKHYSKTFIGVFRRGGYPFRIDIVKNVPNNILDEVYSANLNIVGYPEVLKEAHVFSKLGKKDSILLRGIVASNGVKICHSEPYRELLLGVLEHRGDNGETL